MDGVTDQPYRYMQKKYGRTPVVYTEFTSVEGVCHGADRLLEDFLYDESQRPIVAQIYGTTPEYFRQTATLLCELGFDGIDINMGCPAKNVAHSGAGAALIENPQLAQEIIKATKAGVTDWLDGKRSRDCADITESIWQQVERRHNNLPQIYQEKRPIPVSVKTRIGYSKPVVEEWIPTLLEMEPAVIGLHGRTLKQHYSGLANWEEIGKAADIIHKTNTLVLGNGDIETYEQAVARSQEFGTDGVLMGRATFGNPYALLPASEDRPVSEHFMALEHSYMFDDTYSRSERYNFWPMRKHLGWYVKSIPHAAEIRKELFATNSPEEIETILLNHDLVTAQEAAGLQELRTKPEWKSASGNV